MTFPDKPVCIAGKPKQKGNGKIPMGRTTMNDLCRMKKNRSLLSTPC